MYECMYSKLSTSHLMSSQSQLQSLKMDGDHSVKLIGYRFSPFVNRVIFALKLKGIEYDYIEEDLENKSDFLLFYNPVHKQVPVLVHNGIPIVESLVILEYIEKTWPDNYPLLPHDPFDKDIVRFWAYYPDNKVPTCISPLFLASTGEEYDKAVQEFLRMLTTFEEHGLKEMKFFGGDTIGLADLSLGVLTHWVVTIAENIVGVSLIEREKFPRICAWMGRFVEVPEIKENLPHTYELNEALICRSKYFQHIWRSPVPKE